MTLAPLDQAAARKKLIQLAQIRSMGTKHPVPFFREVAQVNEIRTGKQRKDPIDTVDYCGQVEKAICGDYCASLFFNKTDLTREFRLMVCRASNEFYSGREITE